MAGQQCPLCKSDSYLNPNIRILVSPCFHKLCEQCVFRLFAQGPAPCPECKTQLRRINFIASTFEDVTVEQEMRIRKLMNAHFLKEEEEFSDPMNYNDYLEEFENTVQALSFLKNEAQVKERIAELKNGSSILNHSRTKEEKPQCMGPAHKRHRPNPPAVAKAGQARLSKLSVNCELEIPLEIMKPCEWSGLTKEDIFSSILNSLYGY